jgi:hypothetical protein
MAVRHDQAAPDYKSAILAIGDLRVIFPDKTSPLGNQKITARGRVIDVFANLRRNLAGEIGIKTGDKKARDYGSGLYFIF